MVYFKVFLDLSWKFLKKFKKKLNSTSILPIFKVQSSNPRKLKFHSSKFQISNGFLRSKEKWKQKLIL